MSSTNVAIQPPNKPLKRPDDAIRRRLRAALDMMVWDGLPFNEAALACKFSVSAMRKALNRPHVAAYLRREREVFRASASPRNIHRLIEIRDAANNMPAVNAIKVLEQIDDQTNSVGVTRSPHMTIQILNVQPDVLNQKVVDADPPTIPNSIENDDRGESS